MRKTVADENENKLYREGEMRMAEHGMTARNEN
jgi:hypothetical protein